MERFIVCASKGGMGILLSEHLQSDCRTQMIGRKGGGGAEIPFIISYYQTLLQFGDPMRDSIMSEKASLI